MKIGIITIQKCDNFGADLQAYALGAKLRSLGYDAENIDYLFYKHPQHSKSGGMEKPVLPISLVNKVKERLFPVLQAIKGKRNLGMIRKRHQRFDAWFRQNVKVGHEYRSVKSLYDDPLKYDVYMVGSDQVWNPRLYSNIKPYFLDFAPTGAKCVSYASSFGVSELPGGVFYKYKQWLKRFAYIGLREKKGEEIVKAMALGVEVKHVVDPTLLLTAEEWGCVANRKVETPMGGYVLLYDLIASSETVGLARKLAEVHGWKVVRIGDGAYGPGEFLGLFAKASAVVTNSFHGTVFSILNQKLFYTVIPRTMTNASRIESLLDSMGLRSRMLRCDVINGIDSFTAIDWAEVATRLEGLRKESVDFLIRSIEEPPRKVEYKLPLGCYAVWNKDDAIRSKSTSGGAFSAIAAEVFKRGGVVFGAAFEGDFKSVRHIAAKSFDELAPLRESKYVWSDPSAAYKLASQYVEEGKLVLFSGTPCQCAAIRRIVGENDLLITVDIVCHGTPRSEVFSSYVDSLMSKYGGAVTRYEFRNKDRGWNFPNIVFEIAGRIHRRIPWLDPYFHGYSISAFMRRGCYSCPFANLNRPGDLTVGDCWRVAASHPQYDDGRGVSVLLINSGRGMRMWNELVSKDEIAYGKYELDLAQARNMPLMQVANRPSCYEDFRHVFDMTSDFTKAAESYLSAKKDIRNAFVYLIKRIGWFYFRRKQ